MICRTERVKTQQLPGLDPILLTCMSKCMTNAAGSHEERDVIMQSVGSGLWTVEGNMQLHSDPYLAPG